eukprot:3935925-Rhodomonas_salina.1
MTVLPPLLPRVPPSSRIKAARGAHPHHQASESLHQALLKHKSSFIPVTGYQTQAIEHLFERNSHTANQRAASHLRPPAHAPNSTHASTSINALDAHWSWNSR